MVVLFAFGLAVPTIVLFANGNDKASAGPNGMHLTKEEVAGRELFAKTCFYCHALRAAPSYGRTGPDLDILLAHMDTKERQRIRRNGDRTGRGPRPRARCRRCSTRAGKPSRSPSSWRRSPMWASLQTAPNRPATPNSRTRPKAKRRSRTKRPNSTTPPAELAKGKEVFTSAGCGGCHTLAAAEATGTIGPNLDRLQPGEFTVQHQVYSGGGLMPKFGVEGILKPAEIEAVAKYVSSVAGTKGG